MENFPEVTLPMLERPVCLEVLRSGKCMNFFFSYKFIYSILKLHELSYCEYILSHKTSIAILYKGPIN